MSTMHEESKSIPFHVTKFLYKNRYCNQKGFSILIYGGKDIYKKIQTKFYNWIYLV